jgi:ubiquinone/menaquinone biosynthesis C-methylase UbiE
VAPSRGLLGDFANVDASDSADLVGRLDVMHSLEFFKRYKAETFRLMGAGPGRHLADVGCGTGDDAAALAHIVGADGSVVGFDSSDAMLDEARRRHGDRAGHLCFTRALAEALGVADSVFDGLRTDRVYVHLPDPAAAVREAVRVVKPGGRIVVSEPDMASFWCTASDADAGREFAQGIAESLDNAAVARDLFHLLRDGGLVDVQLHVWPLVLTDPAPAERVINFQAIGETLIAQGRLDEQQVRGWLGDMRSRVENDRFLGGLNFFIVVGEKPA